MGNWQREGESEEEEEGVKKREKVVQKTERLWMERMESLDSVGLYLILVARQPMNNRGERDGGQERDHTGWWSDMWIDQKRERLPKHPGRAVFTHSSELVMGRQLQ